jgi:SAM-dependent methyltransferase
MKNYHYQKFTTGGYTEYFKNLIVNFPEFQKYKKMKGNYLDIGCGSGTQIYSIAPYFKDFSFTGIDISEPNIYACNETLSNISDCLKFHFIHDDFIEHEFDRKFNLAFSYSAFQLMDTSIDDLLIKVWKVLEPEGHLILSTPYICRYNKYLNYFRGILGQFRCDLFDKLIVDVAHILYRKKFSQNFLRERLIYLDQIDNTLLELKTLEGLCQFWKIEFQEKTPSPSFIQSRHITLILKKHVSSLNDH